MTGPVYANNGGISGTTGSSLVPSLPSGTSIGDLLVLEVEYGIASAAPSPPSGWTTILSKYFSGKTDAWGVFYQVFAGGGAPTITGGTYITAVISRFTGANTSTPIGAVGTYSSGTTSTITSSALNTTANNSLVALALLTPRPEQDSQRHRVGRRPLIYTPAHIIPNWRWSRKQSRQAEVHPVRPQARTAIIMAADFRGSPFNLKFSRRRLPSRSQARPSRALADQSRR